MSAPQGTNPKKKKVLQHSCPHRQLNNASITYFITSYYNVAIVSTFLSQGIFKIHNPMYSYEVYFSSKMREYIIHTYIQLYSVQVE